MNRIINLSTTNPVIILENTFELNDINLYMEQLSNGILTSDGYQSFDYDHITFVLNNTLFKKESFETLTDFLTNILKRKYFIVLKSIQNKSYADFMKKAAAVLYYDEKYKKLLEETGPRELIFLEKDDNYMKIIATQVEKENEYIGNSSIKVQIGGKKESE